MQVNAYLAFDGQCEAAFRFYERLLGGRILMMSRFEGSPAAGHVPKDAQNQILHARMRIGDDEIMASDAPGGQYRKPQGISISLNVGSIREAERIFNGLADGGSVQMALARTFWAVRFGMCEDRFGIPWMVNCEKDS